MARYRPTPIPDDYFIATMYGGIVAGYITTKYCGRKPLDVVEWVQTDRKTLDDGTVVTYAHVFSRRYEAAVACNTHDTQRRSALVQGNGEKD